MNRPLWNTQNDLAEKVRAGAIAAKSSRLPEYRLDISSGREHVTSLSAALATFGASARAGIDAANTLGDADTADLFTEISRGVDKLLWKVEAHAAAKD
jgi:starvation-inducible DNA-binding protein